MGRRLLFALLSASLLVGLAPVTEPAVGKHRAKHAKKRLSIARFASDTGAEPNPRGFWGNIECENDGRHQLIGSGGDPNPTITGEAQGNDSFRRLTVFDGDDFWGERCELGSETRKNTPTAVYREGTHWITEISARLPQAFPYDEDTWQVVLQMKQAAPAANSSGTPVLSLDAYDGQWHLRQSLSAREASDSRELWSGPITGDTWTRFSFDVHYSRNPSRGSVAISADLNGDGDFADSGESSGQMRTYTLKVELPGGGRDGIKPGQSIPSHLHSGLYHDEDLSCPPPTGCYMDLDNVQLLRIGA